MSLCITDAQLPGLSSIDDDMLRRITGCDTVGLLRFRYRPGKRAVLHVETQMEGNHRPTEGVIWFFAGDKAKRLSHQLPASTLDETTGALYECFPADHRLPELQQFMTLSSGFVDKLFGGRLADSPRLRRYRPGISCTVSCVRQDGVVVYVKIIAKDDVTAIARLNQHIARILGDSDVSIARSRGIYVPWRAIAYEKARGLSLAKIVALGRASQIADAIGHVAMALERLSSLAGIAARSLGRKELMIRAKKSQRLIAVSDRDAGRVATDIVERMMKANIEPRCLLIHGDMKLEHAFLDADRVTFIDTESLSLGDPDYDLAKLEARLVASYLTGMLSAEHLIAACKVVAEFTSPNYSWFLDAAVLQTAKYFAQRPGAENAGHCRALLRGAL